MLELFVTSIANPLLFNFYYFRNLQNAPHHGNRFKLLNESNLRYWEKAITSEGLIAPAAKRGSLTQIPSDSEEENMEIPSESEGGGGDTDGESDGEELAAAEVVFERPAGRRTTKRVQKYSV